MRLCDLVKRYETGTVSVAVKKVAVIVDDHGSAPLDVAHDEVLRLAEEVIWLLFFPALWEGPLKSVKSPVDLNGLTQAWKRIPAIHLAEGPVQSVLVSTQVPAALPEVVLWVNLKANRLSLIPRVVVPHVSRMAPARLS